MKLLVLFLVLFLSSVANAQDQLVDKPAPAFITKTYNGDTLNLDSLKGKIVVLDFWATWCEPCVAEMPSLKRFYNKYKNKNVALVSISLDDTEKPWRRYIKKNKLNWIHAIAPNGWTGSIPTLYGIEFIPTMIVIDEKGIVIGGGSRVKTIRTIIDAYLKTK
jgi:thiol-disulfide isomerase/thioredoxin